MGRFTRWGRSAYVAAVVLASFVAVGAFATLRLLEGADRHYRAALTADRVELDLNDMLAASYDLTTKTPVLEGVLQSADAAEVTAHDDSRQLQHWGFEPDLMRPVSANIQGFDALFDWQRQTALTGDTTAGLALANREQTALLALSPSLDALQNELGYEAQKSASRARWGILGIGLGVFLVVAVGFAWDGRRRRMLGEQEARAESLERFEAMIEGGSDSQILTTVSGKPLYVSPAITHILGYERVDRTVPFDTIASEGREELTAVFAGALEEGRGGPVEIEMRHADGSWRTMEVTITDLRDVSAVGGILWQLRDVTERATARRTLEEREATFRLLFDHNPQPMWVFDRGSLRFLEVNEAAVRHYGYSRDEFLAMTIADIRPVEDVAAVRAAVDGGEFGYRPAAIWRHITKSGQVIDVEVVAHNLQFRGHDASLALAADITDRLRAERDLVHRATHDPLTDLPNRMVLGDRLSQLTAGDGDARAAVIVVGVDRLKVVNDAKGHHVGDEVLRQVAERLTALAGPSALVARLGGDEFAVVLDDVDSRRDAAVGAVRIAWALEAPFVVQDLELDLTVSQGICLVAAGDSPEEVLSRADAAMYSAKEGGRARYEFAGDQARRTATDRFDIARDLRQAIERDELVLHYQPIVALDNGEVLGAEALVRWNHPRLGLLGPDRFIPIAEDSGLIVSLGSWVLSRAVSDVSRWPTDRPLDVAVNVSALQFHAADLLFNVARTIAGSGVDPNRVHLEITENTLICDVDRAASILSALKEFGVQVDIDDFGMGYSSLAYVQRLPVDTLKVDKTFVSQLDGDNPDPSIVTAVIKLGDALGLRVLAEGVETERQRRCLQDLGCRVAQGYFFSRAVPLEQFLALAASRSLATSGTGV